MTTKKKVLCQANVYTIYTRWYSTDFEHRQLGCVKFDVTRLPGLIFAIRKNTDGSFKHHFLLKTIRNAIKQKASAPSRSHKHNIHCYITGEMKSTHSLVINTEAASNNNWKMKIDFKFILSELYPLLDKSGVILHYFHTRHLATSQYYFILGEFWILVKFSTKILNDS